MLCCVQLLALLAPAAAVPAVPCNKQGIDSLRWFDGAALGVRGRAFNATSALSPFERLPPDAVSQGVRPTVYGLSRMPAGQFLQFRTDACCIFVNYTLPAGHALSEWHFASTGVAGADLYAWDDGGDAGAGAEEAASATATWRWTGTAAPSQPYTVAKLASLSCDPRAPAGCVRARTYRLHLPTYSPVYEVRIGVNAEAALPPTPDRDTGLDSGRAPIVWYGSSILQGGVASRPGQVATHIVSRALRTEVMNFGFSGNGLMELPVARYLGRINASMIIVDCNPNMNASLIAARTAPLVRYLRGTPLHADTPIVLSEGTPYGTDFFYDATNGTAGNAPKNAALATEFAKLVAAGDSALHYAHGSDLLASTLNMSARVAGSDVDPTVGGTHLTDLGMRKQAAYWTARIPEIFAQSGGANPGAGAPSGELDLSASTQVHVAAAPTTADAATSGDTIIVDAAQFVLGRLFGREQRYNHTYDRFPLAYSDAAAAAPLPLRPDVWRLSEMSTGEYLRFTTDAQSVTLSWRLRPACAEHWFAGCHLYHMPDSGTSAFDAYIYDPRGPAPTWRHLPFGGLHYAESGAASFYRPPTLPAGNLTYLIYLPLRNAPAALNLTLAPSAPAMIPAVCGGGDSGCTADVAPHLENPPPVLWYGTSIVQGGVASRAGNAFTSVIGRALGRDIINIGFANNGVMDLSVGQLLCDAPRAAAIVIDCLPNMNAQQVANRTAPLVRFLRDHGHSRTPIVLAEGTPTPGCWFNASANGNSTCRDEKSAALRASYETLVAAGDTRLHYVDSASLFKRQLTPGPEGTDTNPTVSGIHSSDLGQYEIADFYASMLPTIL